MTTTAETIAALKAARELISDPAKWTQGALSRTSAGRLIGVDCQNACQFCAVGALYRVTNSTHVIVAARCELELGRGDITVYNDQPNRKHSDVLAVYDATIARLETQP